MCGGPRVRGSWGLSVGMKCSLWGYVRAEIRGAGYLLVGEGSSCRISSNLLGFAVRCLPLAPVWRRARVGASRWWPGLGWGTQEPSEAMVKIQG